MTRVAFIGAGNRSVSHMTSLSRIADTTVVGIADIDESRTHDAMARANQRIGPAAAPLQADTFSDWRAMVDAVDPDCLYLCLPPFVHGELDHALIDVGKPLLFEKPVALEMTAAKEIAAHVQERGIVNAVGYQKRYSAAVRHAVTILDGVPIGMAIAIRLSGLPGQPWWRVQQQSGGMLVEQHTHAVDLMRVLCGEIETVYAVGNTSLLADVPNLDIFDVNACTVRFANGAPGIIGNSCAAPMGDAVFAPHQVHIVAQDMMLSVSERLTSVRRAGTEEVEEIQRTEDDNDLLNRAFMQAVRAGTQDGILCDFADAVRTLAVTLACQLSAERGRPLELAELYQ